MLKESWVRGVFVWLSVFAVGVLALKVIGVRKQEIYLKYSEFQEYIENQHPDSKKVEEVTLRGDPMRGDEIIAKLADQSYITTYAPYDETLRKEIREKLSSRGIQVNYEQPTENHGWLNALSMWLPLIIMLGLMFLFFRNMQGAGGRAFSFGKSKAKMMSEGTPKITFKDVAGIDEAKQECGEIIDFLKDHKKFQEIGARIPKGVLMMGSPGTGKTLLARAIAGEAGVPFFHISGSDFVEMFVGVGASRVRDLFENAQKNAPCIIFIDEIDAVGRHRGAGVGGGHDEREQTLNQLLVEMDGFESKDAIIVIAATNRPDVLDPALLRPGRFDRRVIVNLPDVRGRKEILQVYLKKIKTAGTIDAERIALGTPGFSGAELENLVNEAALFAARTGARRVTMGDFESAKDKILMGPERKGMVLSADKVRETAYHEVGHAITAHYLNTQTNVHKITVIPRGRALGITSFLPKDDVYTRSKENLLGDISVAMGGRAAEEIKYNHFTTGASNDIKQATDMARSMVCQFGMSRLGPINYGQKSENPFLGKDWGDSKNYSESLAFEIDKEVSKIIEEQYEISKKIILDHIKEFEHVSQVLMVLETLDSDEFIAALNGSSLEEIKTMQENKAILGHTQEATPSEAAPDTSPVHATDPSLA